MFVRYALVRNILLLQLLSDIAVAIKPRSQRRVRPPLHTSILVFAGSTTIWGIPRRNRTPIPREISNGAAREAPRSSIFPSARILAGTQPQADGVVDAWETGVAAE